MSGLLALLDDVAAIAKLAASQLDDIAGQAAKASSKVAGVVIDDAAVTPKYVTGLPAARELPIVWKIARGSLINKLLILLPLAMLLDTFAPWSLPPLLMLGGAYLCFEGAEKVWHAIRHEHDDVVSNNKQPVASPIDKAHLEETRVKGAIKTDFILSAEIMTITLSTIEADHWLTRAAVLALAGIGITVAVYGAVALLVKADDAGLRLSQIARTDFTRNLGRAIVVTMPKIMNVIATIGTAAMLWVGGNIIVHGLHELGWHLPYDLIHHAAETLAAIVGIVPAVVAWIATATLDGITGLALGLIMVLALRAFSGGNSQSAEESAS